MKEKLYILYDAETKTMFRKTLKECSDIISQNLDKATELILNDESIWSVCYGTKEYNSNGELEGFISNIVPFTSYEDMEEANRVHGETDTLFLVIYADRVRYANKRKELEK